MSTSRQLSKVYRLRNLPAHVDRLDAAELVASAIHDPSIKTTDVQIFSLATAINSWTRWQRKVATLTFSQVPSVISKERCIDSDLAEWKFRVAGLPEPLVLDTHFHGLTPLNDIESEQHQHDCIAISGLASHPLGSWQPRGDDKSFMWIRDILPQSLPGIRFILYGYNTVLSRSNSFQTIVDLTRTLILELDANGWASPPSKPLLFLAHSLGGILIKQMLVMLANGNDHARYMLGIIKGAFFFGTPSTGMPISHLLAMVEDQPNRKFITDLSNESAFLTNLETQFQGIAYLQKLRFFWAYETKTSPIVERLSDGSYSRSSVRSTMVHQHSATGGRYLFDPESTIQIDEDHSGMVKFSFDDRRIPIIISKINQICYSDEVKHGSPYIGPNFTISAPGPGIEPSDPNPITNVETVVLSESQSASRWDYKLILDSMFPPDRDSRVEQIDASFGRTFEWAISDPSVGLTQWLRNGEDIFWISGKPGSGKSTLMKFLLNNPHTMELLHNWRSKSSQIILSFFFHYRGTLLQKSFDGLLRSLLSQILEKEPRLQSVIIDSFFGTYLENKLRDGECGTLTTDLQRLFNACHVEVTGTADLTQLVARLEQTPILHINSLLQDLFPSMGERQTIGIKRTLLTKFQELLNLSARKISLDGFIKSLGLSKEEAPLLRRLIDLWLERCEIDDVLRKFISSHKATQTFQETKTGSGTSAEKISTKYELDAFIQQISKRQRNRQQKLIEIHLAEWPRNILEHGIVNIIEQTDFDLEICIFFDALDEYDGRPEVICDFLKDLIKKSPASKTRTKILFSSRPWPIFIEQFQAYRGFKIHEHTQEDIQVYCAGFLPLTRPFESLIQPWIGEIVQRARGVFLWVKLVFNELITLAATTEGTALDMTSVLRECLNSIPNELEDYYSSIVQRLPANIRKHTYILMEIVSRSASAIYLKQIPQIIQSGNTQTFQEANLSRTILEMTNHQLDMYLRTISGGLVDLAENKNSRIGVHDRPHRSWKFDTTVPIQLLHQTCQDWVESSMFKNTLLGDRASVTWENGHSFLVKLYGNLMSTSNTITYVPEFVMHALKAEATTGVSQYTYLSQLPTMFYTVIGLKSVESGLSLAVFGGLWLYLKESIQKDPLILQETREPLFHVLMMRAKWRGWKFPVMARTQQSTTPLEVTEMGKYLLEHGFQLESDMNGLTELFERIWDSTNHGIAQRYMGLVAKAVERSLRVGTVFPGPNISDHALSGAQWTLLHLSPPPLARLLLERGAPVNGTNSKGETPLDYLLSPGSLHQTRPFDADSLYEMACLLVQNGGLVRRCQQSDVQLFLSKLEAGNYDTAPLESLRSSKADSLYDMRILETALSELNPTHARLEPNDEIQPDDVTHSTVLPDCTQSSEQLTEVPRSIRLRKRDRVKQLWKVAQNKPL